ncbi:MAG: DUF4440 domain-containing protein [Acidimicrobiia bacterium]
MTRNAIAHEIERLHQFFEDWFNGVRSRSIEEFSDALDETFFIVSPMGDISDKARIVEAVDGRRGASPVEIHIGNVRIRRLEGELLISTYEERQIRETESTVMAATVGLVPDSSRPGGFRWIFVHESWLQQPEG